MNRIDKLTSLLKEEDKFPYIVFSLKNIEYLTGFKGTNGYLLIADENNAVFITDSRYEEYARKVLPDNVEFYLQKSDPSEEIGTILGRSDRRSLFLEEHSLTFSFYLKLQSILAGVELIPGGDIVNEMRIIKDDTEIEIISKAAEIADNCVGHLTKFIKPGMTEWDVAIEIESYYKSNGCTKTSFDSIVASGIGASMPHYLTSREKVIQKGEALLIDMGCTYRGYNSDLTRTLFVGTVDPEVEKIYNIVLEAQIKAVEAVKPGILTADLDAIARDSISNRGYGEYFGHSLGHGVGIDVHELPGVKATGETELKPGMVITIEPGIYLPEVGGVRIEDMVLVTETGYKILTNFTKEITVI